MKKICTLLAFTLFSVAVHAAEPSVEINMSVLQRIKDLKQQQNVQPRVVYNRPPVIPQSQAQSKHYSAKPYAAPKKVAKASPKKKAAPKKAIAKKSQASPSLPVEQRPLEEVSKYDLPTDSQLEAPKENKSDNLYADSNKPVELAPATKTERIEIIKKPETIIAAPVTTQPAAEKVPEPAITAVETTPAPAPVAPAPAAVTPAPAVVEIKPAEPVAVVEKKTEPAPAEPANDNKPIDISAANQAIATEQKQQDNVLKKVKSLLVKEPASPAPAPAAAPATAPAVAEKSDAPEATVLADKTPIAVEQKTVEQKAPEQKITGLISPLEVKPTQRVDGIRSALVSYDFKPEESDISAELSTQLDSVVQGLQADYTKRILIVSYSSSSDSQASTARRISLKRALGVRNYIIGKGIESTRINVQALGDTAADGNNNRLVISNN